MSNYEIANDDTTAFITNEQGVTCRIPGYVTRYDGDVVRIEDMGSYHRVNLNNLDRELREAEQKAQGPLSPGDRVVAHSRVQMLQHIVGSFSSQKQR